MSNVTIDRAVLEQAVEALDSCNCSEGLSGERQFFDDLAVAFALIALREALYAPSNIEPLPNDAGQAPTVDTQPEPVAWTHDKTIGLSIPLYTHPFRRKWEPLSLDQISMAWDRAYRQPLSQSALNFARDLENTLKERNDE